MPQPKQSARNAALDELPLHVAPSAIVRWRAWWIFPSPSPPFSSSSSSSPPRPPTCLPGRIALVGAGAILLAMWVLYQFLFFRLTDATPGMRYAKIALCTFDDENPSRSAMRARIVAMLLSALPLGLGFLWSLFDEDTLSWHDRITRTYQRSYRDA